jgi:Flp pilus assembly protein TadG
VRSSNSATGQRGQVLVLFTLALVAIVAGVGLVIDGGFTFAQRRAEQNAADLAAFAGADALLNGKNATAAALAASKSNGYEHGVNGITVAVSVTTKTVKVDVGAPHSNYFAGVVGQPTWQVSVTATALAGIASKYSGVAPIIFSQEAFDPVTGLPFQPYTVQTDFTHTTGQGSDSPLTSLNVAWTNLGTGNVSTKDVTGALDGSVPINANLALNDYIGQSNDGLHNALFDSNSANQPSVNTTLAGLDVAVPIVGPPIPGKTTCNNSSQVLGCFRGWAVFHVVSATKNGSGDDGTVTGYFLTGITRSASVEDVCAVTDTSCTGLFHGGYVGNLVN